MGILNMLVSPLLLAEAQEVAPTSDPFGGTMMLPVIATLVLAYFLLIRPERKKRTDQEQRLKQLKKHDRIVTVGGIFGTITNVSEGNEEITIKVDESSNTRLRILRSSVSRVVSDPDGDETK